MKYALTPGEEEDGEADGPVEEVRVPTNMKPFLNKDINFELFVEMLTNKVDR
jgi:hypothetical protein